ncbi:C40 family peptidase [Clostridium sp. 19966]|uniref:C40 family peptidase n=1 Tax=Clostridium sp. 19966 TaxID=2768166 RepID=UPI0028DF2443|nr:NlpC/P60 family protein [Clostridium sp. 19966]MDT8717295.1 C40 family peptidase [Clostridium sp. 19966]
MNKKILTIIATVCLTFSFGVVANADTVSQLNQQLNTYQQKNSDKIKQINDITSKLSDIDNQISDLTVKISKNKTDLNTTEANISETQKNIQETQDSLDKQQELLDKRIRQMYKNGSTGYLGVILEASSFSDLFNRVEAVDKMSTYDNNVMAETKQKKEELQNKKKQLDVDKAKIVKLTADYNSQQSDLKNTKASEKAVLDKMTKEYRVIDANVTSLRNQIQVENDKAKLAAQQLEAAQKQAASTGALNRGSSFVVSSNSVVSFAEQFLNVPYVYGGSSPSGFDCSGLMQYVYAHFGVDLPRVAQDQAGVGTAVSKDALQPGDLVFFGSAGNITHVGMYVGGGSFIEAPYTGANVRISDLSYRSNYVCARRVK